MSVTATFAGKTVFITGGCGGLGLAIADAFYAANANVAVADINKDLCQAFKNSHDPERTVVTVCDITKEENVTILFDDIKKKFTTIDIVVNNAGMVDRMDPAGTLEKGVWDRIIALNLTAPMMITKEAIVHMLEHDIAGSIINIGSVSSVRGYCAGDFKSSLRQTLFSMLTYITGAAYTASKHGLVGLTKNTAAFYAKNKIRCNAVLPGGMATNIQTGFAQGISQEGLAFMQSGVLIPTIEVQKVAELVAFLASDAATAISGACIAADNGWLAQ